MATADDKAIDIRGARASDCPDIIRLIQEVVVENQTDIEAFFRINKMADFCSIVKYLLGGMATADDKAIDIRGARASDCPDIIRLIQELADYEKMPNGPKIDAETLRRDGFGPEPMFRCLVAEHTQTSAVVGYALYFFSYSTWEGMSVYLEDLYVTPTHRHVGIGTLLWREVAKVAVKRKCRRLDWVCLGWNKQSIEFYKSKGSRNMTSNEEWNLFRLDGEALIEFANGVK